MKIKSFYNKEEKKCYLFEGESFDNTITDYVTIDIENHNTLNLHDFFQKKLIESLLKKEKDLINLNDDDIKNQTFYSEDSFSKLLELINDIISICNNTIEDCFTKLKETQETKEQ